MSTDIRSGAAKFYDTNPDPPNDIPFYHETLNLEMQTGEIKVTCNDRKPLIDKEKLILYPKLVNRKHLQNLLIEEAILKISMHSYHPQEIEAFILTNGFIINNRWEGYNRETYGHGPELVIEFEDQG